MKRSDAVWLVLALMLGAVAGYLDQHTDDTGIIAFMALGFAFVLGMARPRLAWLWALIIGLAIPAAGVIVRLSHSPLQWPGSVPGSLLALLFTFAGAYAGAAAHKALLLTGQQ